ncbi:hypothetical protein F5B21DRAFT_522664 [Xylaria acuta]|nr:hypothetical protein F5B21DRAFT_522664 [Xylaria acuta]
MPGKGPAQHRLLVIHGPFGALGPRAAQIASNNAIRRSARFAAAVVNDAIAGREPLDATSEEENLEDFLEDLTEDDSMEEESSDDEVSGFQVASNQTTQAHEPQHVQHNALAAAPAPALASAPATADEVQPALILCLYCDREFNSMTARRRHELDRHVGTICRWPGCGTVTATEDELIQHFLDHQRDAVAQGWDKQNCPWPNCGKAFSRGHSVQRCFKRHNRG